mgnify:CR=1 FL=1
MEKAFYLNSKFLNLGINLLQGYGLTETAPVIAAENYKKKRYGSVGVPLENVEVEIVNQDANGIGELRVKGPNVMLGYYENEEATKAVLKDGWFYTGDLGYFDNSGSLHLVGRKKRLITTSTGKNIYPAEIEKMIMAFGNISKVVVYLDKNFLRVTVVTNLEEGQIVAILKDVNNKLPKYKKIKDFEIKRELA